MLFKEKFGRTPVYGFIPKEKIRFRDKDLFYDDNWLYIFLKKIKLWYGTPKPGNPNLRGKIVLGIQSTYKDFINNKEITTEKYCGSLSNEEEVEVKELELKDNEYFTKFNIDFEEAITHLKFTTNTGRYIEVGEEKVETKKSIDFNSSNEPYMIHSFVGIYNSYGLFALGSIVILRKYFNLIKHFEIIGLRHYFKKNKNERKKWKNPENLNQLSYDMKAICKLCTISNESIFVLIMKFFR